jgi:uncharacterized protein (DUF1800 family)
MTIRVAFPALICLLAVPASAAPGGELGLVNRLTWGQTAEGDALGGLSPKAWLQQQLHPPDDDGLPPAVEAQIAAMRISQVPVEEIAQDVRGLQMQIRDAKGTPDAQAARKPYRRELVSLALEAQTRSLLRDLYSRNQLKEQLTWFWMNHFNVSAKKRVVAALVGDYEENAIRPHVLGKFRDLLTATMFHPAMLVYLDNAQNAVGKINENYAREIMELHTMGVGSGYTQQDVQELARILTGVGANLSGKPRAFARFASRDYRAVGMFEFIPARHDMGDKTFLGHAIKGSGLDEVRQAADILARQPATAAFISRQLAQYFCCDAPSDALVKAMAASFQRSDGDIATVLGTLFASPEFNASLGKKFKDPMHYAVSTVRTVYGRSPVVTNMLPLIQALNKMGEPLYGHETPDGYPLTDSAWSGPGAMAARFDFAGQFGGGAKNLFLADTTSSDAPPAIEQTAYYRDAALPAATMGAIAQGSTQADRNMLFLSSPEFMRR